MVVGIEKFREKFKDFTDCYTIIGGAACDILMGEANTDFRATKDIDMILLLEDRYTEFAKVFWEYIKEGGYKCGWKNRDQAHFYRFTEPVTGYPVMIELFSRKSNYHLEIETGIIPIHIKDDISSLSAILINDDFYNFMLKGRQIVQEVAILGPEYLIPFKMYAWLDLKHRKSAGEHVNSRDLKKHKNDVFRLLQIVTVGMTVETNGMVKDAVKQFVEQVQSDEVHMEQLGLDISFNEAISLLREMYLV